MLITLRCTGMLQHQHQLCWTRHYTSGVCTMRTQLSGVHDVCMSTLVRAAYETKQQRQTAHLPVSAQESRTYWFNPSSLEAEDEFMLIGLVLGLAIYNAVLLDFPLPAALYRKLLGQAPGLRDLAEMSPTLGKSLQALLDYQGAHFSCSSLVAFYLH